MALASNLKAGSIKITLQAGDFTDPGEWGTWLKSPDGRFFATYVWQGGWIGAFRDWTNSTGRIVASGGSGDDFLIGGRFNDQISGNDGNDALFGGDGNDTLSGGNGNDTLVSFAFTQWFYDGGSAARFQLSESAASGRGEQLYGGEGNDLIVDGALNGFLKGGAGNDTILGGAGGDFVDGAEGNDVLYGGSGGDRLYGGIGNDWLEANGSGAPITGADGDALYGGADDDTLVASGFGKAIMMGDDGNDTITVVGAYNVVVNGGRGNDRIDATLGTLGGDFSGAEGDDVILTGTLIDVVDGGQGSDFVDLGAGDDTAIKFSAQGGWDTYSGGDGYDSLVIDITNSGNAADYAFDPILTQFANAPAGGTSGNFGGVSFGGFEQVVILLHGTVVGAAGRLPDYWTGPAPGPKALPASFAQPGDDPDTVNVVRIASSPDTAAKPWVDGAGSDDIIIAATTSEDIGTLPAGMWIRGGAGNDTLVGMDRDDRFQGGEGDDYLFGGDGSDTLNGGGGSDLLDGGNGNDLLDALTSRAEMRGGAGHDTLYGSNSSDTMDGGDGNDMVATGWGDDNVSGGHGNDVIDANGTGGTKTLSGGSGIDYIFGGSGDEQISGGSEADVLNGNGGGDFMSGGSGADLLFGGAGNDTLSGDGGADTLHGEDGNDTFVYGRDATWAAGTFATFDGNLNRSYHVDVGTGQYGRSLDFFWGGTGRDTLVGTEGRDAIFAVVEPDGPKRLAGIDRVSAGGGSDVVDLSNYHAEGGLGGELYGGGGDDVLIGSVSDDLIAGGIGNDTLAGGGGNDRFVFSIDNQFGENGQSDLIVDFQQGDSIWIAPASNIVYEFLNRDTGYGLMAPAGPWATKADDGGDAVLTFSSGSSVRVAGVSVQQLTAWGAV